MTTMWALAALLLSAVPALAQTPNFNGTAFVATPAPLSAADLNAGLAYAETRGTANALATIAAGLTVTGKAKVGASGWLEALIPNSEGIGQAVSIHPVGGAGIIGASRTSDSSNTGGDSTWGGGFFVLNDNSTQIQTVHGIYTEVRRYPAAGIGIGVEAGMVNRGAVVDASPYGMIPPGLTAAYWTSAGRTDVSPNNNPTMVLGVVGGPTGTKFESGIIFAAGSVAGGVSGFAPPIVLDMPQSYALAWRDPSDGGVVASIRSDATAGIGTAGGAIVFANNGVNIQSPNNQNLLTVDNSGVTTGTLAVTGPATVQGLVTAINGLSLYGIGSYTDNAAAAAAGWPVSRVYVTPDGTLKLRSGS